MKNIEIMKKVIEQARKGEGKTSPNPLVGAILFKNKKIIGQGYHKKYGSNHAEVEAINDAINRGNKNKIKNSTLYINLEPCCHFGNTSPCVDEIIKYGIKKVIVACLDPNKKVNGKGIKKLRENNIKVELGSMEKEAIDLNKYFFKFIKTSRPYVIWKSGMSLDGKITHPKKKYITNKKSLEYVHKIRNSVDAILVGVNTVVEDNPRLNIRLKNNKKKITPIILDPNLKIDLGSRVLREGAIIVIKKNLKSKKIEKLEKIGVRFVRLDVVNKKFNLKKLLTELGKLKITSLLVEGGQTTSTEFINQKLVDKIYLFISLEIFGQGELPILGKLDKILKLKDIEIERLEDNLLIKGNVK
ncbi:MAG: bifunctional diaminohydroxyphosphoribosylaminopyrimidine deaminase/5-amino-6-(5-phosphoribosylamino)uracil reductase RibD [Parcubacteria group bacterium]|nr:bifunctional diaminohydroxyphosphoribosylaminopyrimidine deaminase/5-amino-6-(5-phosphoribosylamino)uracil reductase RibD [Parcubacteria group bacterium]